MKKTKLKLNLSNIDYMFLQEILTLITWNMPCSMNLLGIQIIQTLGK